MYMVHTKLTAKIPDKHSQQARETNHDCFINEHVLGKYYTFNHLLELESLSIGNRPVSVLSL